jgi:hypothetical protein
MDTNQTPSKDRGYYEPDELARIRAAADVIAATGMVRKVDVFAIAMQLEEAGVLKEKYDKP